MNKDIIDDRNIDEFIGICKGVLADNEFNNHEKKYLIEWIENHNLYDNVAIKTIYYELKNTKDLDDLKNLLISFTGGNPPVKEIQSMSTQLPIETMLLPIKFENESFCLTGKFPSALGNRKVLEDEIELKGGICKKRVTLDLDYLVIGELGNNDWRHSNYGRKIENAMKIRENKNSKIKIISEKQLLKDL
jgi:NAD-dependent DNA ligase